LRCRNEEVEISMTRTTAREIAVRLCFCISENPMDAGELIEQFFEPIYYATLKDEDSKYEEMPDERSLEYISRLIKGIHDHSAEIDGYIEKHAKGWKFGRISRTAVAIMKSAMFEVLYMPDIPNKAAINEAVELSKRYEPPETVSFVNGILGSFVRG